MEFEDAIEVLRQESGRHLDPVVVNAFIVYQQRNNGLSFS